MAVHRYEFGEWRQFPLTQELMKVIAEQATAEATKILTNTSWDRDRDQYSKGVIAGLSAVAGWTPDFILEDGEKPQDALNED